MTNLREYNMNGTIILGVDAGYGNFKTARTCFPTSVTKSMSEPTISKDCTVMPQCYAAVAENLREFKGMNMVADIGNGTMNVMILNNGKASENKSWTVKMGVNNCFMKIRNLILNEKNKEIPAEIIENYLRYGNADVGVEYQKLMEQAAKEYADEIFAELRNYGYDSELMRLYIMGGGATIIELVGDYDKERVTFDHDIRANAKGYEYFCYMKLRSQAKAGRR